MIDKRTLEDLARADAVRELAAALCETAGSIMKKHGDDPKSRIVLGTGFLVAIESLDKELGYHFKEAIAAVLSKRGIGSS